jgi:2-methylcitrate dehydratase PrpD
VTARPQGWDSWQSGLFDRVDALARGDVTLDDATRRRALLVLIDDLAAMATAADQPQVRALSERATQIAPQSEALHVTGRASGRTWAAMVNAVAANWNELDEGYRPATCHGGLYALPAAMAEAQAAGQTLGDLLRGLVAGYEVATAFARALPPERPLVLHPHASLSPIGAAAAVAALRGERGPGILPAVSVAATLAAVGPFEHAVQGELVRNGWAGHGALTGFTAVELASAGVVGSPSSAYTVLHDCLGYPVQQGELDDPPGRWAIHDGYHKAYACCQYAHGAVEATLSLVDGPLRGCATEEITSIVVETHPLAQALDDAAPRTVLGGKFSVPHTVASVLVSRSAEPGVFGDGLLDDARVDRLRRLVTIEPYPGPLEPPHDRPARVTIGLADGRQATAECLSAVGGPDRPLSDEDVLDKATMLTERALPAFPALAAGLLSGAIGDAQPWSALIEEMWSA